MRCWSDSDRRNGSISAIRLEATKWRRLEADLSIGAHAGGGSDPTGMDGNLFGISEP
jgi:hypothetical protein